MCFLQRPHVGGHGLRGWWAQAATAWRLPGQIRVLRHAEAPGESRAKRRRCPAGVAGPGRRAGTACPRWPSARRASRVHGPEAQLTCEPRGLRAGGRVDARQRPVAGEGQGHLGVEVRLRRREGARRGAQRSPLRAVGRIAARGAQSPEEGVGPLTHGPMVPDAGIGVAPARVGAAGVPEDERIAALCRDQSPKRYSKTPAYFGVDLAFIDRFPVRTFPDSYEPYDESDTALLTLRHVLVGRHDLSGDGAAELLVYIGHSGWCARNDCELYVFKKLAGEWRGLGYGPMSALIASPQVRATSVVRNILEEPKPCFDRPELGGIRRCDPVHQIDPLPCIPALVLLA